MYAGSSLTTAFYTQAFHIQGDVEQVKPNISQKIFPISAAIIHIIGWGSHEIPIVELRAA